jgi:hypothetical protein
MRSAARFNVTFDLTGWIDEHTRDMDAAIADLTQVGAAAEKQTYSGNIEGYRFGIARLILEKPEQLGEQAPDRAARTCFLNAIGKFISFLDKLIASQRNAKESMVIDRPITDTEDLKNYLMEKMKEQLARVASDHALSNPKKIDCIAGVDETVRKICLAYFQLRRTLEHHQDTPKEELIVPVRRAGLFIDDVEITLLPHPLFKGQKMEVRLLSEEKIFSAGSKIVLSPQDAHDLVFTMRNVLAPEIFRAHIDGPAATSASRQ